MKADRASLRAAPTKMPLNQQERAELAANWAQIACRWCGWSHGGVCTRVKRMRTSRLPNGAVTEDITLWDNDHWAPPPDAISPADVFPGGIQAAPIEATASVQAPKPKGKK